MPVTKHKWTSLNRPESVLVYTNVTQGKLPYDQKFLGSKIFLSLDYLIPNSNKRQPYTGILYTECQSESYSVCHFVSSWLSGKMTVTHPRFYHETQKVFCALEAVSGSNFQQIVCAFQEKVIIS